MTRNLLLVLALVALAVTLWARGGDRDACRATCAPMAPLEVRGVVSTFESMRCLCIRADGVVMAPEVAP